MVKSVYPEFPWEPTNFKRTTGNYWKDLDNQRKFLEKFSSDLKFSSWKDWYKISGKVNFFEKFSKNSSN